MLTTETIFLNKPELTDVPDITVLNANWDTIDSEIQKLKNNKVDAVAGKGLSTNDFTDTEMNKLKNIEDEANKYTHPESHPSSMISGLSNVATSGSYNDLSGIPSTFAPKTHSHDNATTSVGGYMSPSDKTKLDNLPSVTIGEQGASLFSEVFNDTDKNKAVGISSHAEGGMTFAGTGSRIAVACDWDENGYLFIADGNEPTTTLPSNFIVGATVFMIDENYYEYPSYKETYITSIENNNTFRVADQTIDDAYYYAIVFNGNQVHSGGGCHAEGLGTSAHGAGSHAEGFFTSALGRYSHAEGGNTRAYGINSHAGGGGSKAIGVSSFAHGEYTISNVRNMTSFGKYNKPSVYGGENLHSAYATALAVGNGQFGAESNAFRVTFEGKTYGLSSFNSTGADYAEYFEWKDGNVYNDDRVGKFVTLDGDKTKIANSTDYILGIVSGNASVIGNSHDDGWKDMYSRDEFGRFIYEDVEVQNELNETVTEHRIKLNSEFDSSQEYIARSERKEWDAIGMLGQLVVFDDGTCEVNGYCTCNDDGVATSSETGYRVIKRVSDNLVMIIFK